MIRKFLRKTFPLLLDVLFALSGIFLVIFSIITGFTAGFFAFIGALIGGGITLILSFGTIYLLLDIRDALENKCTNTTVLEEE